MTNERTQNLSDVMTAQMKTDADNKEQLTKRNSAKDLLEDIKDVRNDMVARNYPFQQLSNLILKYEDKAREAKDTPQEEWIKGYNKWLKEQKK